MDSDSNSVSDSDSDLGNSPNNDTEAGNDSEGSTNGNSNISADSNGDPESESDIDADSDNDDDGNADTDFDIDDKSNTDADSNNEADTANDSDTDTHDDSESDSDFHESSDTDLPPMSQECDEPVPWDTPSTSQVVGDGSAASCTADALRQAAGSGGYITFDCGTEPVTISIPSQIDAGPDTIINGGAGNITLDGGGATRIISAGMDNTLSVRNLRFINGKSPDAQEADGIGGAVAADWKSAIEVRNCTFENNTAARGGGAVGVWTAGALTVVSSRFVGNTSWYGGAIYTLWSPLTIINSEFVDNTTRNDTDKASGGAISTDGASETDTDNIAGTVHICGTQIRNSQSENNGGGAYIWVYPPDEVIIDRTTVEGNVLGSDGLGGGMRISNGEITIKNSSFLSNTSDNHGGALYLDCEPTCTITNATFYDNKAGSWGGAISSGSHVIINNVTFAENNQGTGDNALFQSGPWEINNSIFLNNGCGTTGSGSNVLEHGGSGACLSGAISGDPMLTAPADNGGPTFTMIPGEGSAAIGAGTGCEAMDQRGEMRDTTSCDLGAVEVP